MTQAELDREVSQATGETMSEVRRRGFSLIEIPDRRPQVIDWDLLDQQRYGRRSIRRPSFLKLASGRSAA